MAEGQPLGRQQGLGLGAAQSGLEGRGHRGVVDLEQALHPDEVEGDETGEPVAAGGQTAGDRGAAAEGDDGHPVPHRPGQDGRDVVVVAGADDGVGRVAQVAGALAEEVGCRLAAGAQPAGRVVGQHVLGSESARQLVQKGRVDGRGGQGHGIEGGPLVEAEDHLDQAAGGVGEGRGPSRVTPAGGVHLTLRFERLETGVSVVMCYSVTHDVTSSQPPGCGS